MAEEKMERRGLSKMAPAYEKRDKPEDKSSDSQADGHSDGQSHTIEDHGDGTFKSRMADGTETDHPDHLHMLAHIGHHVTGGDKHHVAHHDGMSIHSHGVHESGEHEGPNEHGSGEEAGQHLAQFMGGEGQEQPQEQQEEAPAYGGM